MGVLMLNNTCITNSIAIFRAITSYILKDLVLIQEGGWMHHLFIHLFICWSNRLAALLL